MHFEGEIYHPEDEHTEQMRKKDLYDQNNDEDNEEEDSNKA